MRAIAWNVQISHKPADVRRELAKIIEAHRPDVIALQETYHLHGHLDGLGYQVIQYAPKKGESERAECALLVRNGLRIKRGLKLRMAKRWKGPKAGKMHGGRVYRWTRVKVAGTTWKVASVHLPFGQAPKRESESRIRTWFRATPLGRPTIALGDWNETGHVVNRRTAQPVGARVAGARIDHVAYRNCRVTHHQQLGKHGSDHHAQMFDLIAVKPKATPKPPKTAKVSIPAMGVKAIGAADQQSHHGPAFAYGMCLQRVRLAFGIGAAASDAIGAWNAAAHKHRETDPAKIPAGYPVFWSGGSSSHGHIAISAGNGKCWSTDIRRRGYFDLVPIATIHDQWGLTLLGYATDLNGKDIS